MPKRSEGFGLIVVGASVALILSIQAIWNVALEGWIRAQLAVYVGKLAAGVIERTLAILAPLRFALAIVLFLYRYIKRELRDGMALPALEIHFQPDDERFVRWEYPLDDTHAVVRYY